MQMLMDIVEVLSPGGFRARMSILMWTSSHQRGADDVFPSGLLDAEVDGLDSVKVAFMRAAWIAMKSCLFCALIHWWRRERSFEGWGHSLTQ